MLQEFELEIIKKKLEKLHEIEFNLANSSYSNPEQILSLQKEYSELKELNELYTRYLKLTDDLAEAHRLEEENEFENWIEDEIKRIKADLNEVTSKIKDIITPEHPDDFKDVFLEIRAGAGGDEASIFAGDLLRMYQKFCEKKGWKFEILDFNPNPVGGFKEVIAFIKGEKVYKHLKFESGVHRVQRVPKTEASGRIHTSTATVAVLPEVEEKEIDIDPKDLKIETFRASGAGGQYVNTTDSAVRITHLPTGIVVSIQDERSQHKNKEKALRVLRARINEVKRQEVEEMLKQERKSQVGSGDRSEKIRTYNFMQSRVTDHRVGESWHNLDQILDGNLDEIIASVSQALSTRVEAN